MDYSHHYFKFQAQITGRMNMSRNKLSSIFFAIALSICLSGIAFGQEVTGSIVGTVRDSTGAAVAGADRYRYRPGKR